MTSSDLLLPELFIEEIDGKIYFINEMYDNKCLEDICDYWFLRFALSHALSDKIADKIENPMRCLKLAEEYDQEIEAALTQTDGFKKTNDNF